MKTATTQLKNWLATTQGGVRANLYTITLSGGTVLRWTSSDIPLIVGGNTFSRGPGLRDHGVKQKIGLSVDGLDLDLSGDSTITVNGIALIDFVKGNGLDGATILAERAFYDTWGGALVGTFIRFAGKFSQARDAGNIGVATSWAPWTELLDAQVPADVYQASCAHVVYDAGCGLDRELFKATAAASSGASTTSIPSTLSAAADLYSLGTIIFTSGANNGLRRTIKTQTSGGLITIVYGFPTAPAAGDTFKVYQGCDLTQATCTSKFNNVLRFKGQPYIPAPETAI